MGTILRPVGGVRHIVPCAGARQAAQAPLQANFGAHESSPALARVLRRCALNTVPPPALCVPRFMQVALDVW